MGGLFGSKTPAVETPVVEAPVVQPDAEDPNLKIESQKRVAKRIAASGRDSTFLTKSNKLGGA